MPEPQFPDVHEAELERTEAGLRPGTRGWFVLNLTDAPWSESEGGGRSTLLEPADRSLEFEGLGFNIHSLEPGDASAAYHREGGEEAFLVLGGECVLIVEGEERRLCQWDFFHCPPGTGHVFVGAGTGPCTIVMVGRRPDDPIRYDREETAAAHGASAPRTTTDSTEAYSEFAEERTVAYRPGWLPDLA